MPERNAVSPYNPVLIVTGCILGLVIMGIAVGFCLALIGATRNAAKQASEQLGYKDIDRMAYDDQWRIREDRD